eukprot:Rhum_TRINITY_DN13067_c0_g2::Rhum_TRINITY_DN13067_c0_g2_i1::g.56667::m.56667/K17757/CARKD; ATP-dependent NAD(P)H-hydrate dehydratase
MSSIRHACLCGKAGVRVACAAPRLSAAAAAAAPTAAATGDGVFGDTVKRWKGRVFCGECGEHLITEPSAAAAAAAAAATTSASASSAEEETRRARTVLRLIAPPLDGTRHKGQGGRLGVLGGSGVYTGAPYFAGMSALKVGAELVYMLVPAEAAPLIKGYSPELMVTPLYSLPELAAATSSAQLRADVGGRMAHILPRLHALVVGPGLGTDAGVAAVVDAAFDGLASGGRCIPVVVDADGLRALASDASLQRKAAAYSPPGDPRLVLTPNVRELRLFFRGEEGGEGDEVLAKKLAQRMRAVVVLKGREDIVTDGESVLRCGVPGCPRRVGG